MGALSLTSLLIGFIVLLLITRNRELEFFSIYNRNLKEILLFGFPLIPHVAGGFLINSVDRIILASKIDLHAVGIYMSAMQLVIFAVWWLANYLHKMPWFAFINTHKILEKK